MTTYNYAGDEVKTTYEKAPEKVLAVYQGSIETMIALGLEDRVAAAYGLDNEVKPEWKDGFAKIDYKEEPFAPDKETVTVLQPDLILSWGSLFSDKNLGDVDEWIAKGTNTYINTNTRNGDHPRTLENEYTDILSLGKIFDVEDKAQAIVDEMKSEIDKTVKAQSGNEPKNVMVIEPIKGEITNYGASSLAGDMVTKLGGKLANADAKKVGKEDIVAANPEVIYVVYMAYAGDDPESVKKTQLELITQDPALANVDAVKNGNVHLIMLGDMYAAGPRTLDGIRTIADGLK